MDSLDFVEPFMDFFTGQMGFDIRKAVDETLHSVKLGCVYACICNT